MYSKWQNQWTLWNESKDDSILYYIMNTYFCTKIMIWKNDSTKPGQPPHATRISGCPILKNWSCTPICIMLSRKFPYPTLLSVHSLWSTLLSTFHYGAIIFVDSGNICDCHCMLITSKGEKLCRMLVYNLIGKPRKKIIRENCKRREEIYLSV